MRPGAGARPAIVPMSMVTTTCISFLQLTTRLRRAAQRRLEPRIHRSVFIQAVGRNANPDEFIAGVILPLRTNADGDIGAIVSGDEPAASTPQFIQHLSNLPIRCMRPCRTSGVNFGKTAWTNIVSAGAVTNSVRSSSPMFMFIHAPAEVS